jgi:DNA polymerase-3 subunit delta'
MKVLLHPQLQTQLNTAAQTRSGSYIFHGSTGVGKATAAYDLARRLNCTGDTPSVCRSCLQIQAGSYPDLITIRPEDKPSITIEQVRGLTQALSLSLYRPDGLRLVIIDDAHALTVEAQNALLKLIEEPPPQTVFVLVTSRLEALLPTVRSRCAAIYFPRLSQSEIAKFLEQAHHLKPSEAEALAAASDGAPGVAVALITQPELAEERLQLRQMADQAATAGTFERLLLAKRLTDSKADLQRFGQLLHTRLVANLRGAEATPAVIARQLAALELFRQQLGAKVAPRVAVERLMLGL